MPMTLGVADTNSSPPSSAGCPVIVSFAVSVTPSTVTSAVTVSAPLRSEEHTSELQSLMRISYAVFSLKKQQDNHFTTYHKHISLCHIIDNAKHRPYLAKQPLH